MTERYGKAPTLSAPESGYPQAGLKILEPLLCGRSRDDGLATPLLRWYVGQRLVEHPLMAERVVDRRLALAVLPVADGVRDHRTPCHRGLDDSVDVRDLEHHL